MVNVVNVTGRLVGANTAIDLSPYLEGDIANLTGVRMLDRAVKTVTFQGVIMAAHTHNVEVAPAHTHVLEGEGTHSHAYSCIGSTAWSLVHSHLASFLAGGAFTPTTGFAGAFTPTVDAQAGLPAATVVGQVEGGFETDMVISNDGWMDATAITPAAGSVALTGRRQIHMGDALSVNDYLEITVMYARDAAGIF